MSGRRRMNSVRLQGAQRLTGGRPVQVDPGKNGERVSELQADEHPVLERRAQRPLALHQRCAKGNYTLALGDPPRKGAVVQLVVFRSRKCLLKIVREDVVGPSSANVPGL